MNDGSRKSRDCPPARRQIQPDDEVKRVKRSGRGKHFKPHDHADLGRAAAADRAALECPKPKGKGSDKKKKKK